MSKNGLHLITPTSVSVVGGTATISANGSVSFTNSSTINLNGVFSADYDNYRVVTSHEVSSGFFASTLNFRLRVGGTDNSGSFYTSQFYYAANTSYTGAINTTTWGEASQYAYDITGSIYDFYGPFLTQPTAFRSVNQSLASDVGSVYLRDSAVTHSQSTSYDGFSLITSNATHTLTGRVAVYGMRK